jgi:hypothetical protein
VEVARSTIMMLSSGMRSGDIERCRSIGITRLLSKPIAMRELHNILIQAPCN